jgi:hypothetical protein
MFSIPPQIALTNANVKNPSQNYITALRHKSMWNYKNAILKHWHFKRTIISKKKKIHKIAKLFPKLSRLNMINEWIWVLQRKRKWIEQLVLICKVYPLSLYLIYKGTNHDIGKYTLHFRCGIILKSGSTN